MKSLPPKQILIYWSWFWNGLTNAFAVVPRPAPVRCDGQINEGWAHRNPILQQHIPFHMRYEIQWRMTKSNGVQYKHDCKLNNPKIPEIYMEKSEKHIPLPQKIASKLLYEKYQMSILSRKYCCMKWILRVRYTYIVNYITAHVRREVWRICDLILRGWLKENWNWRRRSKIP